MKNKSLAVIITALSTVFLSQPAMADNFITLMFAGSNVFLTGVRIFLLALMGVGGVLLLMVIIKWGKGRNSPGQQEEAGDLGKRLIVSILLLGAPSVILYSNNTIWGNEDTTAKTMLGDEGIWDSSADDFQAIEPGSGVSGSGNSSGSSSTNSGSTGSSNSGSGQGSGNVFVL